MITTGVFSHTAVDTADQTSDPEEAFYVYIMAYKSEVSLTIACDVAFQKQPDHKYRNNASQIFNIFVWTMKSTMVYEIRSSDTVYTSKII